MTFIALIKSKEKEGQIILLAAFASFISLLAFGGMFAFNNALILCASILIVFTAAAAINIYPERFETLSLSFKASPKYAWLSPPYSLWSLPESPFFLPWG